MFDIYMKERRVNVQLDIWSNRNGDGNYFNASVNLRRGRPKGLRIGFSRCRSGRMSFKRYEPHIGLRRLFTGNRKK